MKLRHYQDECRQKTLSWLSTHSNKNPLNVLATGTGKSVVIADLIRTLMAKYSAIKVACVIDSMELVQQNYDKFLSLFPDAPAGIVSSGIGKKQYKSQIVFGGIQSLYKNACKLDKVNLLIVDEAHMISDKSDSMWRKFIADLRLANPKLKIVGYTATPYRLDSGLIYTGDNPIFHDICYEYGLKKALEDKYLSPLIPKGMTTKLDVTNVKKTRGDFALGELQRAVDKESITKDAIQEIITYGQARKSWLIFSSGVEHAYNIRAEMHRNSVSCEAIDAKTPKEERKRIIKLFLDGKIKCLVNNSILTKGFDAPQVDLIAVLRPTTSVVLWLQIVGRGMRLSPQKNDCLLLDFAQNMHRFGFIDQVTFQDKKKKDKLSAPPVKECPECTAIVHASVMTCPDCKYKFPPSEISKLDTDSYNQAILSTQEQTPLNEAVKKVDYNVKISKSGNPMMVATYHCGLGGLTKHHEYLLFENAGYAKLKAKNWWRERSEATVPQSCEDAVSLSHTLKEPMSIKVVKDGKYERVIDYIFQ